MFKWHRQFIIHHSSWINHFVVLYKRVIYFKMSEVIYCKMLSERFIKKANATKESSANTTNPCFPKPFGRDSSRYQYKIPLLWDNPVGWPAILHLQAYPILKINAVLLVTLHSSGGWDLWLLVQERHIFCQLTKPFSWTLGKSKCI